MRCADPTFEMSGSTLAVLHLLHDREAPVPKDLSVSLDTIPVRRPNEDVWVGLRLQAPSLVSWLMVLFGESEVCDDIVIQWWRSDCRKDLEPPEDAQRIDVPLRDIGSVPDMIHQLMIQLFSGAP